MFIERCVSICFALLLSPQGFIGPVLLVMQDFSRTGISRENLPRRLCLCSSRGQLLWPVFWGGEMCEEEGVGRSPSPDSLSFGFIIAHSIPLSLSLSPPLRGERGQKCAQQLPRRVLHSDRWVSFDPALTWCLRVRIDWVDRWVEVGAGMCGLELYGKFLHHMSSEYALMHLITEQDSGR